MTLGGLSSDANLLSALETATFEEGYDIEKTRSDFSEGRSGVISFTYYDAILMDMRMAEMDGLTAHLSKPVEPDLLFETLEKLIKRG